MLLVWGMIPGISHPIYKTGHSVLSTMPARSENSAWEQPQSASSSRGPALYTLATMAGWLEALAPSPLLWLLVSDALPCFNHLGF